MTTKHYCDRCGKELKPFSLRDFLRSTYTRTIVNDVLYVICVACDKEFKDFMCDKK